MVGSYKKLTGLKSKSIGLKVFNHVHPANPAQSCSKLYEFFVIKTLKF